MTQGAASHPMVVAVIAGIVGIVGTLVVGIMLAVMAFVGSTLLDSSETGAVTVEQVSMLRSDIAEVQGYVQSEIQAEASQRMAADVRLSERIDGIEQLQRQHQAEILSAIASMRADIGVIKSRLDQR